MTSFCALKIISFLILILLVPSPYSLEARGRRGRGRRNGLAPAGAPARNTAAPTITTPAFARPPPTLGPLPASVPDDALSSPLNPGPPPLEAGLTVHVLLGLSGTPPPDPPGEPEDVQGPPKSGTNCEQGPPPTSRFRGLYFPDPKTATLADLYDTVALALAGRHLQDGNGPGPGPPAAKDLPYDFQLVSGTRVLSDPRGSWSARLNFEPFEEGRLARDQSPPLVAVINDDSAATSIVVNVAVAAASSLPLLLRVALSLNSEVLPALARREVVDWQVWLRGSRSFSDTETDELGWADLVHFQTGASGFSREEVVAFLRAVRDDPEFQFTPQLGNPYSAQPWFRLRRMGLQNLKEATERPGAGGSAARFGIRLAEIGGQLGSSHLYIEMWGHGRVHQGHYVFRVGKHT